MFNLINVWKSLRGYKRQAGAIIALVPVIANLFGAQIPEDIYKAIVTLGTAIWGIGWADKGAVEVTTRLKGEQPK
ncbi:hypothetical protein CCP3SC15_300010 [Gammaproteobacteria bacterium]